MLPAALVLTIMIIPITSAICRELFVRTPRDLMDGAMALGSTRWEAIRGVMFAYAAPGISAAVLLGLGRAFGEAIAVTQVIGGGEQHQPVAVRPGRHARLADRVAVPGCDERAPGGLAPLPRSDPDGDLARHERRRAVRRAEVREAAEGGVSETPASIDPFDITVRSNGLRRRRSRRRSFAGLAIALRRRRRVHPRARARDGAAQGPERSSTSTFFTKPRPLFGEEGGIADALVGSALIVGMCMVIAIPVAVLVAIYMSEYARPSIVGGLRLVLDVLNGVPAIVVGIFVFGLLVVGHGQSAVFGAFALAILMLPMVARATQEVLEIVPRSQREASLALGVTKWRTTWSIILPSAIGGILTGVVIAVARVAGETAPLLFTSSIAANQVSVDVSQRAADAAGVDLRVLGVSRSRTSRRPAGPRRSS